MALKTIRLELARTKEFPDGSQKHGYEFTAPLDEAGHLDAEGWKEYKQVCSVLRFWGDREEDERGLLIHHRTGWAFSYAPGEDDDEPIFRLSDHVFRQHEYITITEHDGVARTFQVASIGPPLGATAGRPGN